MAQHNEFGILGEREACTYLSKRNYRILERNWHSGHLEVDIIAEWFGEIVFVEVKTRRNEQFAPAEFAVDIRKQEHLVKAALAYLSENRLDAPYRFDIITVVGTQPPFKITHLRDAYTPETLRHNRRPQYKDFSRLV